MSATVRTDRGRRRPLARLRLGARGRVDQGGPRYGAGRSGSWLPERAARSAFLSRAIQRFTAV